MNIIAFGVIGTSNSTRLASNDFPMLTNLIARMESTTNCPFSSCKGYVWFSRPNFTSSVINVAAYFPDIGDGQPRGLHIHSFGDISSATGSSTGPHWNPLNRTHNLPPFDNRHQGDLGNVQTYYNGQAW
eukprot:TRINITY_DN7050_c0_g1_i2.p1 TRINITY_DN7050_c0_g1~~TRINITY_DN7050_c0_g1_i2.p1  ORF type:complete len:129 (+),score=17.56 TRINITY_DN7050_c0_g1_i2:358-744(+)